MGFVAVERGLLAFIGAATFPDKTDGADLSVARGLEGSATSRRSFIELTTEAFDRVGLTVLAADTSVAATELGTELSTSLQLVADVWGSEYQVACMDYTSFLVFMDPNR